MEGLENIATIIELARQAPAVGIVALAGFLLIGAAYRLN